ncbi:MAG: DUF1232 domain-containing protein [Myxococcaceae bacterium]|nr:DUF1232 domain-containing protein [Myxococcaceae bacterium]
MNLVQIRRYFRDEKVAGWRKFVVVGAVAYVLLPIDLVPDLVPLLGWLDDIGAVGAALAFFSRDVANHAANDRAVPAVSSASSGDGVQIVDAQPLHVRR